MGWLDDVVAVAVEEARERDAAAVEPEHLALALTRDEHAAALVAQVGAGARRWRDHINFVLGVNAGMRAARHQQVRPGHKVSAAKLYADQPPAVGEAVAAIVAQTHREAIAHGEPIGLAWLLTTIMASGAGGIAAGTARWAGLTAAGVRRAAGLSTDPRPLLAGIDPSAVSRPAQRGPVVLLGGGPTPPAALRAAVDLAAVGDRPARVAVITAAAPWRGAEQVVARQQQFGDAGVAAVVVDVGLADRGDADRREVIDALDGADIAVIDGGRCELAYRALAGTAALEALVRLSDRGGLVVGYSAGAQLLGVGMLTDWMSWGERHEPHRLLGWLPTTAVHPHASGAGELDQLRATVAAFADCHGLGVAHGGAVSLSRGSTTPMVVADGWDQGCVALAAADDAVHVLARPGGAK